ncbi:CRTAC1 family protein [candidate division WOR-3 bacterium]|nr:CRTAC1 family protein [candidate division WOR-3 bacterium]
MHLFVLISLLVPAEIYFNEVPITEHGIDQLSGSATFTDYNSDGIIDFWAGYAYLNDGQGNFTKQTASNWPGGRIVCFGDYDNDGYPDILTTRRISVDSLNDTCYILLYRNLGPPDWGVEDVSSDVGLTDTILNRDLVDVAWLDYDNDGWLDFYVSSYEFPMSVGHEDYLYHNNGDGTFTDVSQEAGVRVQAVCSRGVSVGDFNDDNRIDIFVSVYRLQRNLLFENQGNGTFLDVADAKGVIGEGSLVYKGHNIGACWGDFDNDGCFDLFTPITHHPGYPGDSTNHLWINRGPPDWKFTDHIWETGIINAEIGSAPSCPDYDNDGYLDLYWVNLYGSPGAQGWLYRNEGGYQFTDVTGDVGLKNWKRKNYAIWADINSDGFLDAYIPYEGQNSFFVSDAGNDNHWLVVNLKGKGPGQGGCNLTAIGARVTCWTKGIPVVRELAPSAGNGYGSPFNPFLHFGLGTHHWIDSVIVRWPSGTVQRFYGEPADRIVYLTEGKAIYSVEEKPSEPLQKVRLSSDCKLFTDKVSFAVQGLDNGRIGVFDVMGCKVAEIALENGKGEWRPSGNVSQGVYFVRLLEGLTDQIKIIYVK